MLQRKNGATQAEIMETMAGSVIQSRIHGWGGEEGGYAVESFKPGGRGADLPHQAGSI